MTLEVPDDIAAKSGWINSRVLKAVSPGMEKLSASLVYSNGQPETKEVESFLKRCQPCWFIQMGSLSNLFVLCFIIFC